jgi:uncharacterized RDD family membrane protein YckC
MSEGFTRAGILVRVIAKILDFILIAAAVEIVPKAGFFAGLTYLLIGDALFGGGSLGKKLIGLRVVSAENLSSCTFRDSILRNSLFGIGYIVSRMLWLGWIAFGAIVVFEFIVLLGSRDQLRAGDEIAGTLVVEIPRIQEEV